MNLKVEFESLLLDATNEMGVSLKMTTDELAAYMAERAEHLASISHEPGFSRAVSLERNNVALAAGLSMSDGARMADQRLIGMISGALRLAALAMA